MSTAGSNWFATETTLLDELRRLRPPAPRVPEIPGYDDLAELRRGGQGIVYTATQRSTRRKVAIKVLLDSTGDHAARRRFEREIDLVASLRHPRIVSVYDSGATADGRPFLVMEYVEGLPLGEFLNAKGWSPAPPVAAGATSARGDSGHATTPHVHAAAVRPVVDLLARIAEAVAHAHQRGVIHRDLKPSNIRIDPAGEPRVLDFGLAKLGSITADDRLEATLTLSGQFMGSLAWASPEQAAGDSSGVDTRSDVYSLGVLLYHALTGTFPYDVRGGLRRTLNQIATAPPARPSRHAAWIDDELDTVVLKCLSKDPERRYQSAGDLAAELRRYLVGEPVLAKGDSTWYTVRTTVRRHRGVFIGLAALTGVMAVSSVVLALMYARARDAEALATQRANEATKSGEEAARQAAEKSAVAEFLRTMLASPDPTASGKDTKVVDVLDKAAAQLHKDQGMSAGVRAALLATLAETYAALGKYQQSKPLFEELAQVRATLLGPDHWQTLEARRTIGVQTAELGDLPAGEKIVREVVAAAEALTPDDRARLNARQSLCEVLYFMGRLPESEEVIRAALKDQQAAPTAAPDKLPQILASLGIVLRNQSRAAEAVEILRGALQDSRARLPRSSPAVIKIANSYASALHDLDRWQEAEAAYRDALEPALEFLGEDHSDTITIRSNIGQLFTDQHKHAEAEPYMRAALESSKRAYGELSPTTLLVMNNYAKLLQNLGRLPDAVPVMQACVDGRLKVLGPDHPSTLIAQANLANMMFESGQREEALAIERRILDIRMAKLGEKHLDTIISHNSVGMMLTRIGRPEEGLPIIEKAAALAEALQGPEHSFPAQLRGNVGRVLMKLGRRAEALPHLERSLAVLTAKLGANDPRTKQAATNVEEARAATAPVAPSPEKETAPR